MNQLQFVILVKSVHHQHMVRTIAAQSTNVNATLIFVHSHPIQSVLKVKNSELSIQEPAARSSNASVFHQHALLQLSLALLQVTSLQLLILALVVHLTNVLVTRLNVQLLNDHHATLVNNVSLLTTKPVVLNTLVSAINKSVHNHQSVLLDTNLKPLPELAAMLTNVSATIHHVHQPSFQNVHLLWV
jgi:hypothetical protein